MRVLYTPYGKHSWTVELRLPSPWDWHPRLTAWLDQRGADGRRKYISWVDLDSGCVYVAFETEQEARSFATYTALLCIER